MLRTLFSYATFPLVVGGATAATMVVLHRAVASEVVVASVTLASVAIVALLERAHPYLPAYNRSHGDIATDLLHNVVSGIALPEIASALSTGALHALGVALSSRVGMSLWPKDLPLLLQLCLALVVAELGSYWFHRLQHTSPWWWRMHATHHSAPRLYWLNAARFHPLDAVLSYAVAMFPLVLLGAPAPTLACTTVFITVHGLLQHSNIDLKLGPLNWLFSTAELHRWHHSSIADEANHNYGAVLILWDIVFGTRMLPHDRRPPKRVGIGDMPDFPPGYLAQLASPFTWRALEASARR